MTDIVENRAATATLANFTAALVIGLVNKGVLSNDDVNEFAKTAVIATKSGPDQAKQTLEMMFLNLKLD